ncbi:MAG: pre-peptidase C-terminal domain-containing protein [Phycisphaeraceae bacterium]|nr:MAG: pre-peptidase C-terminal domain-containing protein [Phycisphaeraceae bacterium]
MMKIGSLMVAVAGVSVLFADVARAQTDLLPDITVREDDLYDNVIVTNIVPGRRHIRLSTGTPNIGAGKLYVYGGADLGNGKQQVIQRIYRSNGTFWDRNAGQFVYHPTHSHIHVEAWCQYRIREILPGDGVGDIIAEGEKTSFCILDLAVYNSSLPGFPPGGQFLSCSSTTQGLSVGWMDIYSKNLDGQWIDITDIPNGQYWLEAEADPEGHFLESNENNNASRIKITIGSGGTTILPDAYESNNSRAETLARAEGQLNSPNLGPCNPEKVISNLTIHTSTDQDYFRFYMPATGTASDFVRIEFSHGAGDLDMRLQNSGGSILASSEGTSNFEQISLSGRAAGYYYVQVYGWSGATSPNYTLKINPSANGAPSVTVVNPPAGNIDLMHGLDAYPVTWTSSDPENNTRWVSIYVNDTPSLNGNELLIPTSLNTPAVEGTTVLNSAYVEPGTYWVYASITDGGTTTGAWSSGTITFKSPCPADVNGDGELDVLDFLDYLDAFGQCEGQPVGCTAGGVDPNFNGDDVLDVLDLLDFFDAFGSGCTF